MDTGISLSLRLSSVSLIWLMEHVGEPRRLRPLHIYDTMPFLPILVVLLNGRSAACSV